MFALTSMPLRWNVASCRRCLVLVREPGAACASLMRSDHSQSQTGLSSAPGQRENLAVASVIDTNVDRLWSVAERARARGPLSREDIEFVRDTLPAALDL